MKLLLDFFPIIVFFVAYKLGHIYAATAAAIVATAIQLGFLRLRRQRIEPMHWASLGIIVVFGGATLLLRDETFIKWKPTVLYLLFAGVLTVSAMAWGHNLVRAMMGSQIALPDAVWARLNWLWVGFFVVMGVLNIAVAYGFSTDVWVNFKLFGSLGLTLAFVVAQGLYLGRHLKDEAA
ncbi:MAG: septation protein A [Burkholderiales bacterium]|nr:MAG: septation protein A [Burkholderiales bacterium]